MRLPSTGCSWEGRADSALPPLLWPPSAQCGLLCQTELSVSEPQTSYLATNMADTRTANISKLVLKQAGRAKEKVKTNYQHLSWWPAWAPVVVWAGWSTMDWETLWCDDQTSYTCGVLSAGWTHGSYQLCFGLTLTTQARWSEPVTPSHLLLLSKENIKYCCCVVSSAVQIRTKPLGLLHLVKSKHSGILVSL